MEDKCPICGSPLVTRECLDCTRQTLLVCKKCGKTFKDEQGKLWETTECPECWYPVGI